MKGKFILSVLFWFILMTIGQTIGAVIALIILLKDDPTFILSLTEMDEIMAFVSELVNPMLIGGAVVVFIAVFIKVLRIQNDQKTFWQKACDYLNMHKLENSADYVYYFCLGMAMNVVLSIILTWIIHALNIASSDSGDLLKPGLIMAFCVAFLVPIAEEITFRNRIYQSAKNIHYKSANFLQSFLFGLAHGSLVQGLYTFVFGLLFGYEDDIKKSLLPSICMHCGVNFFAAIEVLIGDKAMYMAPLALLAIPKVIEMLNRRKKEIDL